MQDEAPTADNGAPIHGVTCSCRPDCRPGGACQWVGCCRSPIERARVLPPGDIPTGFVDGDARLDEIEADLTRNNPPAEKGGA